MRDDMRQTALGYQALLIDWIGDLRRRRLLVTAQPQALARLTGWLRTCDTSREGLAEYVGATLEASEACEEASQLVRADQRRRLVHLVRELDGGAEWLAAVEAARLDPLTEITYLLRGNVNGRAA